MQAGVRSGPKKATRSSSSRGPEIESAAKEEKHLPATNETSSTESPSRLKVTANVQIPRSCFKWSPDIRATAPTTVVRLTRRPNEKPSVPRPPSNSFPLPHVMGRAPLFVSDTGIPTPRENSSAACIRSFCFNSNLQGKVGETNEHEVVQRWQVHVRDEFCPASLEVVANYSCLFPRFSVCGMYF